MAFRAAIFDMDGTILDTLADIHSSVSASLRHFGFPERTLEEVCSFVGNGAAKLVERAVPAGTDPAAVRAVLDYYRPYYEAHAQEATRPYPGVPEALGALRAAGVRLAVVSNKPQGATALLAARFFPEAFDAVAGAREGIPVKPAPDLLRLVMGELSVSPAETVYVGDSDVDILTARNTGTACLSVTWGFRDAAFLRESGADQLLARPEELVSAVLGA